MTSVQSNRYRSLGTNPSMYESFNPLTTVNKQHFVEWFSGDALDSIWTQTTIGAGTFAMVDAVDEGFSLLTSGSTSDELIIDFATKNQYSETASVIIAVRKVVTITGNNVSYVGLIDTNANGFVAGQDFVTAEKHSGVTNFSLQTGDGTSISRTSSSIVGDTNFHSFKIECGSSNIKLTLDGVLEVTKTSNRPTTNMQPAFEQLANDAAAYESRIRYLECYNT